MAELENHPDVTDQNGSQPEVIGAAPTNVDQPKHTKMSKSQKRKMKQQRKRQEKQKDKQASEPDDRTDARVIVKDNENLINYYKEQAFFESEKEFDEFLEYLKTSLPASFRINTFDYKQGQLLSLLIEKQFQQFLEAKSDVSTVTNREHADPGVVDLSDPSCIPTLECLDWYPKRMAWQMNVTRIDFRKSSILRSLHRFIQAETDNGFVSRQEAVSMIPPLVLDIKRGQTVLDMCAAPGSKTAQLLEYLTFNIHGENVAAPLKIADLANHRISFNDGLVVANDVDNKRCYMLVHQASRLNSPNCVIINEDASRIPNIKTVDNNECDSVSLKFDRILCDAPCSGDGTLRKNPDVWRKWNTANANNIHGIQSKILKRGVELLKKNGLIVYSTCSMNPVENEAVVANILRMGQGSLVLEDCSNQLQGLKFMPGLSKWVVMDANMRKVNGLEDVKPDQVSQLHKSLFPPSEEEITKFRLDRCLRIFPHHQNTGAFFVALIRKLSQDLPFEQNEKPVAGDSDKRKKYQPQAKRRRYGFKEDPYIFLDHNDHDWKAIKESYGLPDNFPADQLTHKCRSGKKRSIYLVSEQTRDFIVANQELPDKNDYIKVVNGGMRLFMKAQTESGFRICQDGINEILPYISSDLKVPVSKGDLLELLSRRTVPFEELSSAVLITDKIRVGSCVLIYNHSLDGFEFSNGCMTGTSSIEMPLVAWRGEKSLALYVSNTYKIHLRSLLQCKIDSEDDAASCEASQTQVENSDKEEQPRSETVE